MKYRIETYVKVRVATIVEANTEEEAEQEANDRLENGDVSICIHGSEMCDGENETEFVLIDGDTSEYEPIDTIDEYD